MKRLLLAAAVLILAAPARAGVETVSIGGRERWALVREPAAGKAPRPLVLVLHGGGGDPAQAEESYGMSELAAREGFLVAYPAGTGRFKRRFLTWNAGNCCAFAMDKGVDDTAFLAALVEKLVREGRADPKRVYLAGMSNGGMMSHRFACERADLVAAIAPVAATLALKDCRPSRPVAVLLVHGTADEHILYEGGTAPKAREPRVDRSVAETARVWNDAGAVVEVVTHPGGHIWPGGRQPRYRGADRVLAEPKAAPLIWEFFREKSRP